MNGIGLGGPVTSLVYQDRFIPPPPLPGRARGIRTCIRTGLSQLRPFGGDCDVMTVIRTDLLNPAPMLNTATGHVCRRTLIG